MFQNGETPTTQIGFINRNNQRCCGHRGNPGNHPNQLAYKMECLAPSCEFIYGANGCDVWQHKCPRHQGGEPGIPF